MSKKKVYEVIAGLVQAIENCQKTNNTLWFKNHHATLKQVIDDFLPSGSGWQDGSSTKLDLQETDPDRLCFYGSFHQMNSEGFYDGHTEHSVIVTPSLFFGINLRITGKDRNGVKEDLHERFSHALNTEIEPGSAEENFKYKLSPPTRATVTRYPETMDGYIKTLRKSVEQHPKHLALEDSLLGPMEVVNTAALVLDRIADDKPTDKGGN